MFLWLLRTSGSLCISGLKPDISPIVGRGLELSSQTGPVFENSVLNRTADPYFSPRFLKMLASASLLRRSAIAEKCVISSSRRENKENLATVPHIQILHVSMAIFILEKTLAGRRP